MDQMASHPKVVLPNTVCSEHLGEEQIFWTSANAIVIYF